MSCSHDGHVRNAEQKGLKIGLGLLKDGTEAAVAIASVIAEATAKLRDFETFDSFGNRHFTAFAMALALDYAFSWRAERATD